MYYIAVGWLLCVFGWCWKEASGFGYSSSVTSSGWQQSKEAVAFLLINIVRSQENLMHKVLQHSKLFEGFLKDWIMDDISANLDIRQY